ncbi:hypothetical protein JP0048_04880 [Helicobacter pylori]|nr:hypothetical protein JP0048_04880 [Helicobacter pylori]
MRLNDKWDNQKLENKWVTSSYEIHNSESELPFRPIAQLQEVGLDLLNSLKTQSYHKRAKKARALYNGFYPNSTKNSVL